MMTSKVSNGVIDPVMAMWDCIDNWRPSKYLLSKAPLNTSIGPHTVFILTVFFKKKYAITLRAQRAKSCRVLSNDEFKMNINYINIKMDKSIDVSKIEKIMVFDHWINAKVTSWSWRYFKNEHYWSWNNIFSVWSHFCETNWLAERQCLHQIAGGGHKWY